MLAYDLILQHPTQKLLDYVSLNDNHFIVYLQGCNVLIRNVSIFRKHMNQMHNNSSLLMSGVSGSLLHCRPILNLLIAVFQKAKLSYPSWTDWVAILNNFQAK